MKIEVRGKNGLRITDAIANYAENKLAKIEKYFTDELVVTVVCKIYNDHHKVEVTIPAKHMTIRAEVANPDMYAAIDLTVDKIESQIRKHKHRITRSLQKREGVSNFFTENLDIDALEKELVSSVKKKNIKLTKMNLEEAITSMEMLDHDFYIFKDDVSDKVCVLYARHDGDYAVIETE